VVFKALLGVIRKLESWTQDNPDRLHWSTASNHWEKTASITKVNSQVHFESIDRIILFHIGHLWIHTPDIIYYDFPHLRPDKASDNQK